MFSTVSLQWQIYKEQKTDKHHKKCIRWYLDYLVSALCPYNMLCTKDMINISRQMEFRDYHVLMLYLVYKKTLKDFDVFFF